jgi:hypothetical protein
VRNCAISLLLLPGLGLEVWKEVPEVRGITTVPKNGHVYWTTGAGSLYRSTVGGDEVRERVRLRSTTTAERLGATTTTTTTASPRAQQ